MPSYRSIRDSIPAQPLNMGGFRVKQPLPSDSSEHIDPFLLLHYAQNHAAKGSQPSAEGVPPHPHRGFEPVTFIFQGGVHHRDSRGDDSVIYKGGVQWMTAGRGIIHSERPPQALTDEGGDQEIIQLWINFPIELKDVQPRYQGFQKDEIPAVRSHDGSVAVQVVAGALHNVNGPIKFYSPLLALNAIFQAGGTYDFPIPESDGAFVYLLDGTVRINDDQWVSGEHLAHFDFDGDAVRIEAEDPTRPLLMAGEPLNEPVVSSGPFVMSSTTEILEAMRDYQIGKMGVLIEEF